MKALLWTLLALVLVALLGATGVWIAWNSRAAIAATIVEHHLGVPVSIGAFGLTKTQASLETFTIHNPPDYSNQPAFTAQTIQVYSTLPQIRGNPLVIDEIDADQLFIRIETQRNGETNWNVITAEKTPKKTNTPRHYLIKTIVLTRLTVQVTDAKGKITRYPTIPRLEFYNISDETGFPVDQIEKAIFNLMMKDLLQRLNIQQLIKPLLPSGIPLFN